jgi:hypothetical protein
VRHIWETRNADRILVEKHLGKQPSAVKKKMKNGIRMDLR